jgi:hypothetical protein
MTSYRLEAQFLSQVRRSRGRLLLAARPVMESVGAVLELMGITLESVVLTLPPDPDKPTPVQELLVLGRAGAGHLALDSQEVTLLEHASGTPVPTTR